MNDSIVTVDAHVHVLLDEYTAWYETKFEKPMKTKWLNGRVYLEFIRWRENDTDTDNVMAWVKLSRESTNAKYIPLRFVVHDSHTPIWATPNSSEATS